MKKVITVEWLEKTLRERFGKVFGDIGPKALFDAADFSIETVVDSVNEQLSLIRSDVLQERVAAVIAFRLCERAGSAAAWLEELKTLVSKWLGEIDKANPAGIEVAKAIVVAIPTLPREEKRVSRGGGRFG